MSTPANKLSGAIAAWRDELRHELSDNPRGLLPRKSKAAAAKIPDTWPDIKTIQRYYSPITSALPEFRNFDVEHTWTNEINIPAVVAVMDELFEYTHKEILQKYAICFLRGSCLLIGVSSTGFAIRSGRF